jgi:hypothetical protein
MKKRFTLFASLLLALSLNVKATDILVNPTTTSLTTAYADAASGDVLILMDGTYNVSASFVLTKGITIKSQNAKMATIKGAAFQIKANSIGNVTFQGVIIDGTKTDATLQAYTLDFAPAAAGLIVDNVLLDNCNILNYGNCLLRANRFEGTCESFKVNNCIVKNIGYGAAYPVFQIKTTKILTSLELTNSTLEDIAVEYIQFYGTLAGNDNAVILFKNNTFYNTVTNSLRRPFSGTSGKIYVQNNLFVKSPIHTPGNPAAPSEALFDATVTVAELTNNNIFDYAAGALLSSSAWLVKTGNTETDPLFKDVANYDFTLPIGSQFITNSIGDPRWFVGYVPTKVNDAIAHKSVWFNGTEIVNSSDVALEVYNVLGKKVASASASISTVDFPNGIYIVREASNGNSFKIVCK